MIAAALSAVVYLKSSNLNYAAIFILGSVFIDLDHLIDHFLYFKNKFSASDFFSSKHLESGKAYLFLHSWELNCLIFVLGLILKSTELTILSVSLSVHLATDSIIHRKFLPYFLLFRMSKGFSASILVWK